MKGIELIAEERREQIEKHHKTLAFDQSINSNGQLAEAASILAAEDWGCNDVDDMANDHCPLYWDKNLWGRMVRKPFEQRLIIAGALIAAELDRINNYKI